MTDSPVAAPTIRALTDFSDKEHKCARLLAEGSGTNEAAAGAGVTPRTVQNWKRAEHFPLLVEHYRTTDDSCNVAATIRREFGGMDAEDIAKTTLGTLLMIMTVDPALMQDEEGEWARLETLPLRVRMALKSPGTAKQAPQFADRIGAAKLIVQILELVHEGRKVVDMDALAKDSTSSASD